jgi:hypothetical protein
MNGFDDRITFGDGKGAAWAEVVLDVDDYQNVGGGENNQAGSWGATGIDYGRRRERVARSAEWLQDSPN